MKPGAIDRAALKAQYIRERGYFSDWSETLLAHDPDLLRRVMQFAKASAGREVIPDRLRHLIWVAVDSVVTHLFPFGAGLHARTALKSGATVGELMEVMALVCGAHGFAFERSLPVIAEEARKAGAPIADNERALTAEEENLKRGIVARTGFWSDWLETALRAAPDYVRALVALGYGDEDARRLSEKERELILLAIYSCPALLHEDGVRRHSRRALACGATPEELVEAAQVASGIGIHGLFVALPAMNAHLPATVEEEMTS